MAILTKEVCYCYCLGAPSAPTLLNHALLDFLLSQLFTLGFHLIGLISNKLVTLAPETTGTKKMTWGARFHLQEQRAQMEPHIQNLDKLG